MEAAMGSHRVGLLHHLFLFFNLSAVLLACWILVLLPGMEPSLPVLAEGVLTTGPRREVPAPSFLPK